MHLCSPHRFGIALRSVVLSIVLAMCCAACCRVPQATRAYLHREDDVEAALARAGFRVTHRDMTSTSFYFSRLFFASRV